MLLSGQAIRAVPRDPALRAAIRRAAVQPATGEREALAVAADRVLSGLGLGREHTGYAMIACANAYWRAAFAAVPFNRRLLLLPHCLRGRSCRAARDAAGFRCARCGGCAIGGLVARAEALGYKVLVEEGSDGLSEDLLNGERDAVLGVACMETLDRSLERVGSLGLPYLAVPLLMDGCRDTVQDDAELAEALEFVAAPGAPAPPGWLPLLRLAVRLDAEEGLLPAGAATERGRAVDALARGWLGQGGKRLRAFCTLAAYAARAHGRLARLPGAEERVPPAVRRVALAVECMHKASLVHDDIQDEARERHGRPAAHLRHGLALAINIGDHLQGLGYGLVAAARGELGAETAADLLLHLSDAHQQLCLGQGMELAARAEWWRLDCLAVLDIAAKKSAAAFGAALLCGLRCAGPLEEAERIRRFAVQLGTCYQVLDDLDDWPEDDGRAGRDLRLGQATILSACAAEAGQGGRLRDAREDPAAARRILADCGAFARAQGVAERLRARTEQALAEVAHPEVRELLRFLARTALAPR